MITRLQIRLWLRSNGYDCWNVVERKIDEIEDKEKRDLAEIIWHDKNTYKAGGFFITTLFAAMGWTADDATRIKREMQKIDNEV